MKKILLIALTLLCAVAHADDRSKALLDKMAGAIRGWSSYKVEFTLRVDDTSAPLAGSYVVSGPKYRFTVQGREVLCDGALRWEINSADREVTLDKVDPKDRSVLGNPTKVFEFPDEQFTHTYVGQAACGTRKCEAVTLTPRSKDNPVARVKLLIDPATGLPAQITYALDEVGEPVTIQVTRISQVPAPADAEFRFDRSKYKGYEMIDFR